MKPKAARLIRSFQILMTLSVLIGLGWGTYKVVFYLRTAPRFEVQRLSVAGIKRVQESQVLAKARFDLGTNSFRVNLDDMRSRIEELDWVRYATLQRVLPDRIIIRIVEREPIGMARIDGEIYQFDVDAKILDARMAIGTGFPILDGLRSGDRKGNQQKVQTYREVVEELGEMTLSEIHINDSGEVTVVSATDPVLINLGAADFRSRWIKYLQLRPQIQQQYPEAVRVDLRFKNQVIIKMTNEEAGGKAPWGGKKNTL